jgi:hypothetical protein
MKKMLAILSLCCFISFFSYAVIYAAAWEKCKGCHNGNVAKDEKRLKEKYPTIKKFVRAAKKSDDPFMDGIKQDEKLLKEAAQEIGLK